MNTLHQSLIALLCATIAIAVVLNGVHAKDLSSFTPAVGDKKTVSDDQSLSAKIASELHHHIDKQGKTFSDGTQLDSRSLRMLRQQLQKDTPSRLLDKLRNLWQLYPFTS